MSGGPSRISGAPLRARTESRPLSDVAKRKQRESAIPDPLSIAVLSPFQGFAAPERHDYTPSSVSDFTSGGGGDFGGGGASSDY